MSARDTDAACKALTAKMNLGFALGDMLTWAQNNPAFEGLTPLQCVDHLHDEHDELGDATARLTSARFQGLPGSERLLAHVVEEACDAASVALHTALRAGASIEDLARELRRKLEVNKKRKWGPDGRHIEETS